MPRLRRVQWRGERAAVGVSLLRSRETMNATEWQLEELWEPIT